MSAGGGGLILFFSYGVSLRMWAERGLLDREVELYRLLGPSFPAISFVTYGGAEDLAYADRLGGIRVLPNRWRLPASWMSLLGPLLYWGELRRAQVFKTNQLHGAWAGAWAKALHRKRLVVRGGYLWSVNRAREGRGAVGNWLARMLERLAVRAADRVIVTSERLKAALVRLHGVPPARVRVIPNTVNTEIFAPDGGEAERGLVCFVGRLSREKNLRALLEALRDLPGVRLSVIGAGPEAESLRRHAGSLGVSVEFRGSVPNRELPALLNRAEVFVLPSLYEWNPKSLLEAMACGLAVVGSDVDGIRDVIRHGETGLLAAPDARSLREAVKILLADPSLRRRLGASARRQVVASNSPEAIARQELGVLAEVLGAP